MQRHRLTDEQWDRIKDLVSGKEGDPGRTGEDNRGFVEAVLWLARTGAPWRDVPSGLNWNSTQVRHQRNRSNHRVSGTPVLAFLNNDQALVTMTSGEIAGSREMRPGQIRATKTLIREISSRNSSEADWEQMRPSGPVYDLQGVSHEDFIRLCKRSI